MQPDIMALNARGLKLLDKLDMLYETERPFVRSYVACLELFVDDVRPKPATEAKTSNVVSFEDVTSRRVQRAEIARLRPSTEPRRGVNVFGDDIWSDYD